jgi:arginine/lysine/ornithine decarboxylase
MLEYRCLHNASNRHKNVTNDILEELGSTSAKFALFLQSTADTTNGDPFLMGLEKMIDEEKKICQNQRSIDLNLKLHQKLTKLRELYESYKQKINGKKSNQKSIDLSDIYKSIDYVGKYFMVHEQMAAVKQSQQMMLKDYEHEVETI